MKTAYIVRGVSGSGKTTFAESLGCPVISADDFFTINGVYNFDASKLKEAHAYCIDKFTTMLNSVDRLAVANTFTEEWEFAKYKSAAEAAGFTVFIVIVENRHGGENVHGVPNEVLQKQAKRFQVKLV